VRDDSENAAAVMVEKATATAATPLTIQLRASGGFVARYDVAQAVP
jgi:hypothetical protein